MNFFELKKYKSNQNIYFTRFENDELGKLMNSKEMRKKLNISDNIIWGKQSGDVFSYLRNDFMNPVISDVDIVYI